MTSGSQEKLLEAQSMRDMFAKVPEDAAKGHAVALVISCVAVMRTLQLNFLMPLHWSCPLHQSSKRFYRRVLRKRMSRKETEMYRNELKAGQDMKRSRVQDSIKR